MHWERQHVLYAGGTVEGLRLTYLGHATALDEMDGRPGAGAGRGADPDLGLEADAWPQSPRPRTGGAGGRAASAADRDPDRLGMYFPAALAWRRQSRLRGVSPEFSSRTNEAAPGVAVEIVKAGESLVIGPRPVE